MIDTSLVLPDGRLLAYTDCGDSQGDLVMYFHGAPSSRFDLVRFDEDFAARSVRLVSPERPGYGGSSPIATRTRADWANDVAALADHLGHDRFAVMGASSGGPYAIACAALLPERVVGAAAIAAVTDMAWAGAWESLFEFEVTLMRRGDFADIVRWCEDNLGTDGAKFADVALPLGAADLAYLDSPEEKVSIAAWSVPFTQGICGYAQDIELQSHPWEFSTSSIRARVTVVHGHEDGIVSTSHARHTASLIPGAILEILPGHGHLSILVECPRVAQELVAPLRSGGLSVGESS